MAFLPLIAMGATIAGGAISAYGQYQGGKATEAMYNYRAKIAAQNAIYERELGERQTAELGLRQRAQAGQIMAAQGASGLDVGRGSAVEVQKSQHIISRMEQEDVRYSAARRAYGEETQGLLYGQAARQARWAGGVEAAGTVLGTVGSVSSKWMQARSMGINMLGS